MIRRQKKTYKFCTLTTTDGEVYDGVILERSQGSICLRERRHIRITNFEIFFPSKMVKSIVESEEEITI